MEKVVKAVIPSNFLDQNTIYHINPCGNFIIGGPMVSLLTKLGQKLRDGLYLNITFLLINMIWEKAIYNHLNIAILRVMQA